MDIDESEDEITAEDVANLLSDAQLKVNPTPIQIFDYNILCARILLASAEKIENIWPTVYQYLIIDSKSDTASDSRDMLSRLIDDTIKFGSAIFFSYTTQAIVVSVTAFETYCKDRLAHSIVEKPELVRRFADKEIKIERVIELNYEIKNEIGNLIVERNMDFQNLGEVEKIYNSVFGEDIFNDIELKDLKNIFAVRHVIVHNAGRADREYIAKTGIQIDIGKRIIAQRKDVLKIIEYIHSIVHRTEGIISKKFSKK